MTWATARAQLVHMLETDVSGASGERGLSGSWQEDREGQWDSALAAGRFRIRCVASAFNAASSYGQPRFFKDVEIKRGYGGEWADRAKLDEVIWDDEAALVSAFRDTSNWDQPSSCLVSLSAGGAEMLPAERDDEAFAVVTRIALEHY